MWKRIMIAQPGEAAARVARTFKRLGITAIAVAPANRALGPHSEACDEVITFEPREDGTLDPAEIVRVAQEREVEAVYSCFGLGEAERALARALESVDIPYIGADPDALDLVFDRLALRSLAERVHVRFLPGAPNPLTTLPDAIAAADQVGYPITLRSVAATSGVAPRRFDDEDALMEGFASYAAELGGAPVCLDAALERARIVDVLVVADMHGDVLCVSEQETTLEARFGALLDESPSPELHLRGDGEAIRNSLFDSSIRLVSDLNNPGLATVRFHLDENAFGYVSDVFLGLPAQHALAELVTGLDLVAVEIAVASGEPMPAEVHTVQPSGHAFAAVVSLGAPSSDEPLPPVEDVRYPPAPQRQVRVEPAVVEGQRLEGLRGEVLCRVATYAPIRHQAMLALDRVLAAIDVPPLSTNAPLIRDVIAHASYQAGQYDTSFATEATSE